jgi:hypothetical protein
MPPITPATPTPLCSKHVPTAQLDTVQRLCCLINDSHRGINETSQVILAYQTAYHSQCTGLVQDLPSQETGSDDVRSIPTGSTAELHDRDYHFGQPSGAAQRRLVLHHEDDLEQYFLINKPIAREGTAKKRNDNARIKPCPSARHAGLMPPLLSDDRQAGRHL